MDPEHHALPPPATPPRRPPKRSNQLVGVHFESPKRRRPMRKDSAIITRPGLARREQALSSKLDALLGKNRSPVTQEYEDAQFTDGSNAGILADSEHAESVQLAASENPFDSTPVSSPDKKSAPLQRSALNEDSQRLYDNWLTLIPTLEDGYLCYMERAQGCLGRPLQGEPHRCILGRCVTRILAVQLSQFSAPRDLGVM